MKVIIGRVDEISNKAFLLLREREREREREERERGGGAVFI